MEYDAQKDQTSSTKIRTLHYESFPHTLTVQLSPPSPPTLIQGFRESKSVFKNQHIDIGNSALGIPKFNPRQRLTAETNYISHLILKYHLYSQKERKPKQKKHTFSVAEIIQHSICKVFYSPLYLYFPDTAITTMDLTLSIQKLMKA